MNDAADLFAIARKHHVVKEHEKAFQYYTESGNLGCAMAINNLGTMYSAGEHVVENNDMAMKFFVKALGMSNNVMFRFNIGHIHMKAARYEMAFAWFLRSCSFPGAARSLGVLYRDGLGVPKNDELAHMWFEYGAHRGDSDSQNHLGIAYVQGRGVKVDLEQAVHWFRKSAEQNNPYGMRNLAYRYWKGEGVAKDLLAAAAWGQRAHNHGYPDIGLARAVVQELEFPSAMLKQYDEMALLRAQIEHLRSCPHPDFDQAMQDFETARKNGVIRV